MGGTFYRCASGYACEENIDDVSYFRKLIEHVQGQFIVNSKRVYAAGFSNGGAMSFRLACELSDQIAAIAAVASRNQFAVNVFHGASCATSRPVPVLFIYNDADTIISPDGRGNFSGADVSADQTISDFFGTPGWAVRNGCGSTPSEGSIPDTVSGDGSQGARHLTYENCNAGVEVLQILGGGHTWQGGWQYLFEGVIGSTSRDVSANQVILQFFDRQSLN